MLQQPLARLVFQLRAHALEILAAGLFFACFLIQASRPPIADEVDFIKPLAKWVIHGPQVEGLWHAPFYPWILSLLGKLFGWTPFIARIPGAICMIATAVLFFRLTSSTARILLLLILLLPSSLGSALVIDYDTTLLVFSTGLYFFLLNRLTKPSVKSLIVLSSAIALCLMSKETTPLIYPLGIFISWRKNLGFKQALACSFVAEFIAIIIFMITTLAWCKAYNIPVSSVFQMDLLGLHVHSVGSKNIGDHSLSSQLWVLFMPIFWIGIPLTFLFFKKIPDLFRDQGPVAGVTSVILAVITVYSLILRQMTYHFPKYMVPVLIWIPWLIFRNYVDKKFQRRDFIFLLILCVLWFALTVDPMGVLYKRTFLAAFLSTAIVTIPLGIWYWAKSVGLQVATLPSVVLLLTLGQSLNYARLALFSNQSMTYWYGERTFIETLHIVSRWKQENPSGVILTPAKDLALLTESFSSKLVAHDTLVDETKNLCKRKDPFFIVTRAREASSLLQSERLAHLRNCLPTTGAAKDIVYGYNRW